MCEADMTQKELKLPKNKGLTPPTIGKPVVEISSDSNTSVLNCSEVWKLESRLGLAL